MSCTDEFGFVPLDVSLCIPAASIQPTPAIQSILEELPGITNPDGYIYPPIVHTRRGWPHGKSKKVKGSDRGAFLFRLPATHRLTIDDCAESQHTSRYGDAGFLIHFFGLLYGFRCQFHDWWFDGRCNAKSDTDYHIPRSSSVEACLHTALIRFREWDKAERMIAINIMFLHARIGSHEHEWERFQAAYQVADALFALARRTAFVHQRTFVPHNRRLRALCDAFGMAFDEALVRYMVDLRNALLHEALWVGGMPGHASDDLRAFHASIWLSNFARRAFLALVGLDGPYIRSPWWGLGARLFEVTPAR